jgi:hypothetical protein
VIWFCLVIGIQKDSCCSIFRFRLLCYNHQDQITLKRKMLTLQPLRCKWTCRRSRVSSVISLYISRRSIYQQFLVVTIYWTAIQNKDSSNPVFSGVRVVRSLVFYVVFCISLFVLFRFAIALVISSNFSYTFLNRTLKRCRVYISWSHNNNNLKCTSKNSSKKENGAVAGLF